jgi:hypothetical protein
VEEGKAKKGLGQEWIYKTTNNLEKKESAIFRIKVKDRIGNTHRKNFLNAAKKN